MAPNGFTRYIGYDNADVFRNMLIESYAAAKKNGLFFEGRLPMASTTEISQASGYAAPRQFIDIGFCGDAANLLI